MVKLVLYINRAGESNTTSSNPSPNSLPEENESTELPSPSSPLATHNHNIPEITQLNNDINHNNTTYYLPPSIRYLEDQNVARRAFLNGAFIPQLYVAFKAFQIPPDTKILIIFRDDATWFEAANDYGVPSEKLISLHLALFIKNTSGNTTIMVDRKSSLMDLISKDDIKVTQTWITTRELGTKKDKLCICGKRNSCSSGPSDDDDDNDDDYTDVDSANWIDHSKTSSSSISNIRFGFNPNINW